MILVFQLKIVWFLFVAAFTATSLDDQELEYCISDTYDSVNYNVTKLHLDDFYNVFSQYWETYIYVPTDKELVTATNHDYLNASICISGIREHDFCKTSASFCVLVSVI